MQRAQRVVLGNIPASGAWSEGAFYGTAVGWRNGTAEAEVWEAALGFGGVFGGAGAAEAGAAALGGNDVGGAGEAAGREAGAGREC